MEKKEVFDYITKVRIHNESIDGGIKILKDLKEESKKRKYKNCKFILEMDGEDRPSLALFGYREETDEEYEKRIKIEEKNKIDQEEEEYRKRVVKAELILIKRHQEEFKEIKDSL